MSWTQKIKDKAKKVSLKLDISIEEKKKIQNMTLGEYLHNILTDNDYAKISENKISLLEQGIRKCMELRPCEKMSGYFYEPRGQNEEKIEDKDPFNKAKILALYLEFIGETLRYIKLTDEGHKDLEDYINKFSKELDSLEEI